MNVLEKEIEKKLCTLARSRGGWCLKWVCPGWSGVPDRIILLPGARIYFVETKRPVGGTLSRLQAKWREWITALGFEVWIIKDAQQLRLFELSLREG